MGIAHQHITMENADEHSVMQVIMQFCLKLGGDPWLLPKPDDVSNVISMNNYLNPFSEKSETYVLVSDGQGRILEQHDPIEQPDELLKLLVRARKKSGLMK